MNTRPIIENGVIPTLCRMCDTRCAIDVHLKDGVISDITPFQGHQVNHGRMCPRATAAIDQFYHPRRITTPLKRKPDGSFEKISREQALDEIADRMAALKEAYGARSVGFWKGEGVGFAQQEQYVRRFAHAFGSPNYFSNDSACYNGRYLGHSLVFGFWNPFPRFTEAGLILLFGTNPPMCHPPFMREFADARARGAKLVVIDPRLNPVACYADIFAQPYPGTDGALGWGLIRYLIERRSYDHELVERFSVGFGRLARYARRFTPEVVEQETGIYKDVLVQIAEMIIKYSPHVSIFTGAGLEHHENGVNNIRTLASLGCLCGALDRGCGFFWPDPFPGRRLELYEELPLEDQGPIGANRFPVLYEKRRECHSMTAMDYMLGDGDYRLRGLVMTAANPAVTNPNTAKVERALSGLDLLVVNDFFMTPTARLAHYILPAATFLERSELHCHIKYQLVTLARRVLEVPGIRDEYMLWHDLAHRLGFGRQYFPWESEEEVTRWILEPTGISLEDLAAHPEGIVYKPVRYLKYRQRPLPTPSGKIEFASAYLADKGLSELPEYTPPYHRRRAGGEYPFVLTTGARMSLFYHSRHQNIPRFRTVHPAAVVEMHPDDAAELGVRNGQRVRIVSRAGSLEIAVCIVHPSELRRGVVEVYHGWEKWRVNRVTCDDVNDPISGFPLLKGVPVRIEPIQDP